MSRKIILIKQELLLLVYELNRSGLLAENEKIRPILAQLEKLLLCDLSPSTNDSVYNTISFTVFPEIVPSIGNSFINTMKNINHTRSSISDDIRNILCSSANMRRAIPLILRLLMN